MLGGVRTEWQSSAFQAALDSPAAFVSHYISLHADAAGQPEVCLYMLTFLSPCMLTFHNPLLGIDRLFLQKLWI